MGVDTSIGVCGVAPPAKLSQRSKLLLKLVSLVEKLQRPKDELELQTLQVVVCLLECLLGFPELTGTRKRLTGYLTEAKCQVSRETVRWLYPSSVG